MTNPPRIKTIKQTSPFTFLVPWQNRKKTQVDMEGTVYGFEPFALLQDPEVFAQFELDEWGDGIEWPNGLNFSADSLAFLAEEQTPMIGKDLKVWQKETGLSNNEAADWFGIVPSTFKEYKTKNSPIPRAVQIAARAAIDKPGVFQAHYKPRHTGRPAKKVV